MGRFVEHAFRTMGEMRAVFDAIPEYDIAVVATLHENIQKTRALYVSAAATAGSAPVRDMLDTIIRMCDAIAFVSGARLAGQK